MTIKQTLIELFELDKMEPGKAAETADRLAKLVFQAVLMRALPMLSEKDLGEYESIVDSNQGPEILFDFLSKKVPDFQKMITEEAETLRADLAGELETLNS